MIVLDTNVISELMRPAPDGGVRAWIAAKNPLNLAITTITIAEIRRGIERLPNGRQRKRLEERFAAFVATWNTSDFEQCGIGLANPWQSAG